MYTQSKRYGMSSGRRPSYGSSRNARSGGSKGHKQNINPARFVKAAVIRDEDAPYMPTHQFDDFDMADLLKTNVRNKGYVTPSPIQDQAIPVGLQGRDIVGIANTGTGKTAAFALPLLHTLMHNKGLRALIIAPTRELAQQIEAECRVYARGSGLHGALLIGGSSMTNQLRDLKHNPPIIIGTPGRIKDHIERGTLDLSNCGIVVLDEVDRMVDMGFIADIRYLLGKLKPIHQSFFFSATLDPKLRGLVDNFLTDPISISVKTSESSDNVKQDIVHYNHNGEKLDLLHDTLINDKAIKALIFDDTQRAVERLSNELIARGFKADAIHGGKSQSQRERALRRFKQNEINILVATDVAARGIDVIDITHVINYSTPNTYDDYIHRVGRAGRAGRAGQALTFINS